MVAASESKEELRKLPPSLNRKDNEMSYAQALSSSSSGELRPSKSSVSKSPMFAHSNQLYGGCRISGSKRPCSPKSLTCGRYFRTSHSMAECRHQIICLR